MGKNRKKGKYIGAINRTSDVYHLGAACPRCRRLIISDYTPHDSLKMDELRSMTISGLSCPDCSTVIEATGMELLLVPIDHKKTSWFSKIVG